MSGGVRGRKFPPGGNFLLLDSINSRFIFLGFIKKRVQFSTNLMRYN